MVGAVQAARTAGGGGGQTKFCNPSAKYFLYNHTLGLSPLRWAARIKTPTTPTPDSANNMLRSCPSGHGLSKERNHEAQLRCDGVCGTAVEQDAWLWSCTKCDFDLCVT
eukprot:scaffold10901_cov48-Phaeocystis_antarctica.AAC.1